MCGLVGIFNLNSAPVDPALLHRMSDTILHRGPDDTGVLVDGAVGLAHRRLSILDLSSAGHQPMANEDGTIWIVFNGEIYNYVELADELRARGHRFRSSSDTEVILHLYEEEGEGCLARLHGMFAFLIWDARKHVLLAARDRVGIKPLYYARTGGGLLFGSEIKALLAHPDLPRRVDPRGLSDHLFCGYPLGNKTPFAGVSQLRPGEALIVQAGQVRLKKYWDVEYRYDSTRSFQDTAEELRVRLDHVVHDHCRSDAPVGSHLSGGLDSSTVAALAARHRRPLHTFSIRFSDGGAYDESRYARAVAESIGSRHVERRPAPGDLRSLLPFLAWHMDVPMTQSAFSYFTGSRLAQEHVKVVLTGHGGDEIMAGYPAQFAVAFGDTSMFAGGRPTPPKAGALRRLTRLVRQQGASGLLRSLGARMNRSPLGVEQQWVSLHCGMPPAANPALTSVFRSELGGYDPRDEYLEAFRDAPTDRLLDRCLYHDLKCYLPSLLHTEDRVSMSVSIESRVPLLDHTLIEFLATVPPDLKVPSRVPKELLRTAMSSVLPQEITGRRDKGAFFVPASQWLRTELSDWVRDLLLSEPSLERGVFDPGWLRAAVKDGDDLWDAVSVELWCRLHIDADPDLLERVSGMQSAMRQPSSSIATAAERPLASR